MDGQPSGAGNVDDAVCSGRDNVLHNLGAITSVSNKSRYYREFNATTATFFTVDPITHKVNADVRNQSVTFRNIPSPVSLQSCPNLAHFQP